ncbi:response regulator transcription factor [Altererythrobacter sp.]|uniref:response regulator transcription factor n=1 Tax=Altererythrobacter sp. TaxID=1872480 RepID=UPI001B1B12B3|nr:response regulator transcription factor [Altererythrobacter sp.]MBO6945221.1 winged helix-turn-helix domain-containing protein [Altererythrobacter sp.]
MSVVKILLTHPDADDFDPFIHDDTKYEFVKITSRAPAQIFEGPVWIFIDWVLDNLAGLELCRRLRADPQTAGAHITMVLDDQDFAARRRALDAGADDYMSGPIDRRTVLDRILALKPTAANYSAEQLDYGPLTINLPAFRAYWRDEPIEVSPNEFRLLRFLAENANRTLSRHEIVSGLGKKEEQIDERTVDVWIGRLRKAIKAAGGGNPLRTVRSIGYVFDL